MALQIMTEVSAVVADDKAPEVVGAFEELLRQPVPDGLVRTELLRGGDGRWCIHTLWRDRAALDAMRARSEPPAAPTLFRKLGAEPTLQIYEVEVAHHAGS